MQVNDQCQIVQLWVLGPLGTNVTDHVKENSFSPSCSLYKWSRGLGRMTDQWTSEQIVECLTHPYGSRYGRDSIVIIMNWMVSFFVWRKQEKIKKKRCSHAVKMTQIMYGQVFKSTPFANEPWTKANESPGSIAKMNSIPTEKWLLCMPSKAHTHTHAHKVATKHTHTDSCTIWHWVWPLWGWNTAFWVWGRQLWRSDPFNHVRHSVHSLGLLCYDVLAPILSFFLPPLSVQTHSLILMEQDTEKHCKASV